MSSMRLGGVERRIGLGGHRAELEHRVDRHQLDAGAVVELAGGDARENAVRRAHPAAVAVVDGVLHQPPLRVDQSEVDPPGVDRDRVDMTGLARGGPETVEHVS